MFFWYFSKQFVQIKISLLTTVPCFKHIFCLHNMPLYFYITLFSVNVKFSLFIVVLFMLHNIPILYWFPRRSSLKWHCHQARGWKAIRRPQTPIHLTTTSILPRMTWLRWTSSHLRPSRATVRTAARRERTAPFTLLLMTRAKVLRDPDGKRSPWETVAVLARLTGPNLKEKMHLVSI